MKLTVTLLLVLITLYLASERTGVYFLYRNTIAMKHSGWMITIVNELEPYEKHTIAIREQLDQFAAAFSTHAINSSGVELHDIWPETIKFLRKAENNFRTEYLEIQSLYQSVRDLVDMRLVNGRSKRALLPFVGSALSYLFGTVSEGDLDDIRQAMLQLADSQEKTLHLFDENLTALNLTYEGVRTNRKVINKLTRAVGELKTKVNDIYRALERGLQNARIILMIHDVYNIVSDAMMDTRLSMNKLMNIIEHSNQGRLTTDLISPSSLPSLLRTIKRRLPIGQDLPYPLTPKGLTKYYANLRPILVSGHGRFYITLIVPIIHDQTQFEVYDIVNEPVYDSDTKLSAKMILETNSIAVSTNRENYVLLSPDERIFCIANPFCEINSPIYNIQNAEICLTSLFRKDVDKVKRSCKTQIVEPETVPHAHHLFDDQWVITTTRPLVVNKICNGDQERTNLDPGQKLVTIGSNCEVTTPFFHIPQRKIGESQVRSKTNFLNSIETSLSLPHIWNMTRTNLIANLEDIPSLAPLGNIPFAALRKTLENINQQPFTTAVHRHTNTGIAIAIVCVFTIIVTILIIKYRKLILTMVNNRMLTHLPKPTSSQTQQDAHIPSRVTSGDIPSWIPASSTSYNPLTGDVIIVTTGQDAVPT